MPNNVPARIPVRAKTEIATAKTPSAPAIELAESRAPMEPAAIRFVVDRRTLAFAMRFVSRLASRAPMPSLAGCLFVDGFLIATDLDVALRVQLPRSRHLGALVPAEPLRRCLSGNTRPDVEILRVPPTEGRPFAVSVDGAILMGHDPEGFPDPALLFPDRDPRARALLPPLASVLAAAAVDANRKAMNAVFFQLCRNSVVATDGHRLHAIQLESGHDGDFLVPRKAIELVENVRRAARIAEVRVDFFEHQAVFHVGPFDVSVRLETDKFPAWEKVVPRESKYTLRVDKKALLEALDRIAAAVNERARGVRLRKVADGLEIYGRKTDAAELTVVIPARGWREDEMLGVNLGYLHDAVRFAPSEELRLGISDGDHPLTILDGSYLALVMPIRLEKGELS